MTAAAFHTKLAGVQFVNDDGSSRQDLIQRYCHAGTRLTLKREAANNSDPNAIGVWVPTSGQGQKPVQIGHLNRTDANEIAPLLDRGADVQAEVTEVIGETPDKPTWAVKVWLRKGPVESANDDADDDLAWCDEEVSTRGIASARGLLLRAALALLLILTIALFAVSHWLP
jgi:hypothetical protein